MQRKVNRAADHECKTLYQKTDGHPAKTCKHQYHKARALFASYQINTRQSAKGRQPIHAVKLHSFYASPLTKEGRQPLRLSEWFSDTVTSCITISKRVQTGLRFW